MVAPARAVTATRVNAIRRAKDISAGAHATVAIVTRSDAIQTAARKKVDALAPAGIVTKPIATSSPLETMADAPAVLTILIFRFSEASPLVYAVLDIHFAKMINSVRCWENLHKEVQICYIITQISHVITLLNFFGAENLLFGHLVRFMSADCL